MKLPRKAEIGRVVQAAREAGIAVGGLEVAPDGTIRVLSIDATRSPTPASDFDEWMRQEGRA